MKILPTFSPNLRAEVPKGEGGKNKGPKHQRGIPLCGSHCPTTSLQKVPANLSQQLAKEKGKKAAHKHLCKHIKRRRHCNERERGRERDRERETHTKNWTMVLEISLAKNEKHKTAFGTDRSRVVALLST